MHTLSNAYDAEAGTIMGELCMALVLIILHNYTHRETKGGKIRIIEGISLFNAEINKKEESNYVQSGAQSDSHQNQKHFKSIAVLSPIKYILWNKI